MEIVIKNVRDTKFGERFDVLVGYVTIHSCSYKKTERGSEFISLPGMWDKAESKWIPWVSVSKETNKEILNKYLLVKQEEYKEIEPISNAQQAFGFGKPASKPEDVASIENTFGGGSVPVDDEVPF